MRPLMKLDPRAVYALAAALMLQTAGALVWAGGAAARLNEAERAAAAQPEIIERLARLEEQVSEARRALARIERKLDDQ